MTKLMQTLKQLTSKTHPAKAKETDVGDDSFATIAVEPSKVMHSDVLRESCNTLSQHD